MILEGIFIQNIAGKGRGVFCKKHIEADTLIEKSPVIVMDETAKTLLDKTPLHDYIFEWQPEGRSMCCMAMGYVPVYNHDAASNCEYVMDYEAETISIVTMRSIDAGEELTINYNGDWDDEKPVWFKAI